MQQRPGHPRQRHGERPAPSRSPAFRRAIGFGSLALAAAALTNYALARRAEQRHPPAGRFITVDGVRLHYLDRGTGPAIVLLHGNGVMASDFVLSGVFDLLAADHRVIAFDRPGFGFSERPRNRIWDAEEQAALLRQALIELGVDRPVVVGHSWGTLVALSLALGEPAEVAGLVLLAGYYFPTPRADVALMIGPAIPILGDVVRYTISPLLGRLLAGPIYRKVFAPSPVPAHFAQDFPIELALRPWQIRATAADAAMMIPAAAKLADRYAETPFPVAIVAGTGDRIIDFERQPRRLHREVPNSTLRQLPEVGHMVHHTAPEQVASIIREVAAGRAREH